MNTYSFHVTLACPQCGANNRLISDHSLDHKAINCSRCGETLSDAGAPLAAERKRLQAMAAASGSRRS